MTRGRLLSCVLVQREKKGLSLLEFDVRANKRKEVTHTSEGEGIIVFKIGYRSTCAGYKIRRNIIKTEERHLNAYSVWLPRASEGRVFNVRLCGSFRLQVTL